VGEGEEEKGACRYYLGWSEYQPADPLSPLCRGACFTLATLFPYISDHELAVLCILFVYPLCLQLPFSEVESAGKAFEAGLGEFCCI
jgi:hypothetical protein